MVPLHCPAVRGRRPLSPVNHWVNLGQPRLQPERHLMLLALYCTYRLHPGPLPAVLYRPRLRTLRPSLGVIRLEASHCLHIVVAFAPAPHPLT